MPEGTLGAALRLRRWSRGLDQKQVAEEIGVSIGFRARLWAIGFVEHEPQQGSRSRSWRLCSELTQVPLASGRAACAHHLDDRQRSSAGGYLALPAEMPHLSEWGQVLGSNPPLGPTNNAPAPPQPAAKAGRALRRQTDGTVVELFRIIQYAPLTLARTLVETLDETQIARITNNTTVRRQSIGTLHLGLRELKLHGETREIGQELERKIGHNACFATD